MTQLDEFRLRVSIANNQLKRRLADFLITLATYFDQERVKQCNIGLKTTIHLEKYVPNDGKWHHFAQTLDCWIQRDGKKKKKRVTKQTFIDGVMVRDKKK